MPTTSRVMLNILAAIILVIIAIVLYSRFRPYYHLKFDGSQVNFYSRNKQNFSFTLKEIKTITLESSFEGRGTRLFISINNSDLISLSLKETFDFVYFISTAINSGIPISSDKTFLTVIKKIVDPEFPIDQITIK